MLKHYCKQSSFLLSTLSCFLKWLSEVTKNLSWMVWKAILRSASHIINPLNLYRFILIFCNVGTLTKNIAELQGQARDKFRFLLMFILRKSILNINKKTPQNKNYKTLLSKEGSTTVSSYQPFLVPVK